MMREGWGPSEAHVTQCLRRTLKRPLVLFLRQIPGPNFSDYSGRIKTWTLSSWILLGTVSIRVILNARSRGGKCTKYLTTCLRSGDCLFYVKTESKSPCNGILTYAHHPTLHSKLPVALPQPMPLLQRNCFIPWTSDEHERPFFGVTQHSRLPRELRTCFQLVPPEMCNPLDDSTSSTETPRHSPILLEFQNKAADICCFF